jgi:hypothetical protein
LLALRLVTAEPLPEKVPEKVPPKKFVAVIVPAVKFPAASRLTIDEAAFPFVALFAVFAPEATLAAETPPTLLIVAAAVPGPLAVTSPVRAVR